MKPKLTGIGVAHAGYTVAEFMERWRLTRWQYNVELNSGDLDAILIGKSRFFTLEDEADWLERKKIAGAEKALELKAFEARKAAAA